MSKQNLILAACAIVVFIAAILSLMVEKNMAVKELDDLVNGKSEQENNATDEATAAAENN
jgi:hypothetical protein